MKIKTEDYAKLKELMFEYLNKMGVEKVQAIANDYSARGLSFTRFYRDCFWFSKIKIGNGIGTQGDINLYAYMDDSHLSTALKKIVREYGVNWNVLCNCKP
ncbi:hypothetical protein LH51_17575 [Nitrincola sp. A-D6]|uniref:hypothetical protein n=1 Tax=Nitrincola sp. A-D6 TaxID=1545442 RepID=UPI00051FB396|nr:hypothetical protein [Nitrincola sp. A-D6]KGK41042.1 hypothetical protein LH51_17575 [Nitrincola sp. A-D6]